MRDAPPRFTALSRPFRALRGSGLNRSRATALGYGVATFQVAQGPQDKPSRPAAIAWLPKNIGSVARAICKKIGNPHNEPRRRALKKVNRSQATGTNHD